MNLAEFKKRAIEVSPAVGSKAEDNIVIIRVSPGGRKKDHYIKLQYICGGSLSLGGSRLYTELRGEYFNPAETPH